MKKPFLVILFAVAVIMASLAAFYSTSERVTAQSEETGSVNRTEVEAIVRDFITNNPEVLIASLEEYQRRTWAEEMQRRVDAMKESENKLLNDPDSPVIGNPDGDVTVVEFFDYNCGYCKRMVESLSGLIKADGNVKVILKEFPILTGTLPTDYSRIAAKASLAVYRLAPEKYFDFHQSVMTYPSRPTEEALLGLATSLKIDSAALKAEMAKPEIDAELKDVEELAKTLGVNGTPAMIINGELIPGAVKLDKLKELVAKARSGGDSVKEKSADDAAAAPKETKDMPAAAPAAAE